MPVYPAIQRKCVCVCKAVEMTGHFTRQTTVAAGHRCDNTHTQEKKILILWAMLLIYEKNCPISDH